MGFIPPDGGDYFKSTLMAAVVETDLKGKKENGRNAVKKAEKEEKAYIKDLEVRGTAKFAEEEAGRYTALASIMVKGRKEIQKQRLFKCRINKIEFELRFAASRINEIREELKELKEDAESDDDIDSETEELKKELKTTRQSKKDSYQNWQVVTEAEEARRTMLDIEGDEEDETQALESSACAQSSSIATSPTVGSTLTTLDSLPSRNKCSNVAATGSVGTINSLKRKQPPTIPEHIGLGEDEEILDDNSYVTPI